MGNRVQQGEGGVKNEAAQQEAMNRSYQVGSIRTTLDLSGLNGPIRGVAKGRVCKESRGTQLHIAYKEDTKHRRQ